MSQDKMTRSGTDARSAGTRNARNGAAKPAATRRKTPSAPAAAAPHGGKAASPGAAISAGQARARKAKEDRHFVTALARGLEVLSSFRSGEKTLGNQELAERCGLPKSTVSRLTSTLTKLGYLIQLEDSGKYRLGTATLSLGSAMLARLDVRQVARPYMETLAAQSKATVALAVRDRLSMIYIENVRSPAPLTLSLDVGSRMPLAISAIGRAWLAAVSESERRDIMEQLRRQHPADWPLLKAGIERGVADHATLGVTCSFGEWQPDVNGIARALNPGGGLPPMALNCGGASSSLSKKFLLDEIRPRLIEITTRIEEMLAN